MIDAATLLINVAMLATSTTIYYAEDTPARRPDPVPVAGGGYRHKQDAVEEGRLRPRRYPGAPPWKCRPLAGGIRCTVAFVGPERAYRASIRYDAIKGLSHTTATVRPW